MIFVREIFSEFDGFGEAIYYVRLYTFITILYSAQNPRNSSMKIFHSHVMVSLVFMDYDFNLEVVS